MKLKMTVEIKDDLLVFEYEVGKSRHAGSQPISAEGLFLFNDLLNHLHKKVMDVKGKEHEAFMAYAFCKAYPELIKEIEAKMKKK